VPDSLRQRGRGRHSCGVSAVEVEIRGHGSGETMGARCLVRCAGVGEGGGTRNSWATAPPAHLPIEAPCLRPRKVVCGEGREWMTMEP
jgi:hypothetical protein